ncbi:MAG: VWA domain-containing protein, partial [Planctomycetota bacterium]
EELARAVHIDPSQIRGLGPSIDALIAMLMERKAKILATYETDGVQAQARHDYFDLAGQMTPPPHVRERFKREVRDEQLRDLEQLWYRVGDERSRFAVDLLQLVDRLGDKYQVDELASKYEFTGQTPLDVPEALRVKQELETIDRLLEQLREASDTAQIAIIDMQALAEFAEPDYLREMAERQGLEFTAEGYRLTPKAYRIFQSSLLEAIFSDLQAARSGRHSGPIAGEGAVELPRTKPYEFGDSPAHMDITQSMINAMIREGADLPIRMSSEDIEIHHTRNTPKCATVVIMDMSGSMRYDGQYINAKRMGLALDGLVRSEYPGDHLQIVEMYTFARPRHISEIPELMPKPVTLYESMVHLRADMSDERISELDIPQHFTNIQRALQVARQILTGQDTPNRQIILITDGLPTAHFEAEHLYLLYPPHPRTEQATMREAQFAARENITINVFLLPNWGQTEEDVQFAHRMVEATGGRVFFTGGRDLDRFVVWDYVNRRRTIIG